MSTNRWERGRPVRTERRRREPFFLAFGAVDMYAPATEHFGRWQRTAKLQTVTKFMPDSPEGVPLMTYDPTPLELNIAPELLEQLLEADKNWQRSRISKIMNAEDRISYEGLLSLITTLEQEVVAFCSSKALN